MVKPPLIYRISRPVVRLLLKSIFNIRCEGIENIPRNEKYIIISNHQSWLDPLLIMAYLPSTPQIVVLTERHGTTNISWINRFIRLFGNPVIAISRSDNKSRTSGIKQMMKASQEGKILLIFPEGRLSRGEGKMYPFYPGAFLVSKKLKLPILPIGIAGNFELYLRKPIQINIAPKISPQKKESVEQYAARVYHYMNNEVLPSYPGDGPRKKLCRWLTNLLLGGRAPSPEINSPVIRYKYSKDLFKNFS